MHGGGEVAEVLVADQQAAERRHGEEALEGGGQVTSVPRVHDPLAREVRRGGDGGGVGERQSGRGGGAGALGVVVGAVEGVALQRAVVAAIALLAADHGVCAAHHAGVHHGERAGGHVGKWVRNRRLVRRKHENRRPVGRAIHFANRGIAQRGLENGLPIGKELVVGLIVALIGGANIRVGVYPVRQHETEVIAV